MVYVTWPRPFPGWFVIRGLGLATINLPTKWTLYLRPLWRYERRYKIVKMGWFGVTENSTIRQSAYKFLWAFHSNYVPILHRFWDTARYWSKIADMNLPHLYLAAPLRVTPSAFRQDLWHQKTSVPELSYGVVCVILCVAVLVQSRVCQTDRRTNGRTHVGSIYRASIAR